MHNKFCFAAVATILLTGAAAAGQERQETLNDTISLRESVVTSLKIERIIDETPANINIVSSMDVKKHASVTVADVLKYEPGLALGGDGVWATNINVRGLSENRLVTLVDDNRVETATDLTASLSMIDVNDIERVEVIKGAQSSIYGSGAMGGIINIITKGGNFAGDPYFHGNASGSFATVNNGSNGHLSLNAGAEKWFIKANGSYGHADDIMTPNGVLANSGFTTTNLGVKAGFRPTKNQTLKVQFQHNLSTDVGIPGGAAFAANATATYKNISRTLFNANYEIVDLSETMKSLKFNAFKQNIVRDVEMLPNAAQPQSGAMPTKVTPLGLHDTFGGSAQGKWVFAENNTLVVGAEAWRRNIDSDRKKYINQYAGGELKAQMVRTEKPLPKASYTSAGLFAEDESRFLDERLIVTVGGRLDGNFIANEECHNVEYVENVTTGAINDNPAGKFTTFEEGTKSDVSWSGNFGAIFKATKNADIIFNASRSYRSPSLEEFFKFIDLTGNKVRLGNINLKAENGISADLGARYHGDRLNIQASAFINRINNMIVERKANINAASVNDTLILDNAGKALLYGADFNASYSILKDLDVYASGAWTVGREISKDNAYLPMIPPCNAIVGLSYNNGKIGGANLSAAIASAKKEGKIAESDNATEGYCRLDLTLNSKVFHFSHAALQLFGGIENITNAAYTNFLSTNRSSIKCEPGRNFFIRASINF